MSIPLWHPDAEKIKLSQMYLLQKRLSDQGLCDMTYKSFHTWSVKNYPDFWSTLWDFTAVKGHKGTDSVRQTPTFQTTSFFPQAHLNYAENLLILRNETPALIYWCEDVYRTTLSFNQLYDDVRRLALVLKSQGIQKGDCVAGFLPATPEAVIGALATASLGAIWSSCSPDFGHQGVMDRLGQIAPKVLLTTDGYRYKGTYYSLEQKVKAITDQIPSLTHILVVPYQDNDQASFGLCYRRLLWQASSDPLTFQQVPFDHPLFILYSSGTTGVPKCIVHGHGGTLLQHFKEHRLHCDIRPGDRVLYYTTTGWMMWNWLLSGLGSQGTLCLYDGHPDPGHIFSMISQENITHFGTSAKYLATLRQENWHRRRDDNLENLRVLLSTGSPLSPECFDYVYSQLKKDIQLSSISGGTDILSCFLLGNPTLAVHRGELQCAGLGMDVQVFDDKGHPLKSGKGELVCPTPFPSKPVKFWNDQQGALYKKAYFSHFLGIWYHGDYIEEKESGGYVIHGRSDSVLNPGGVRIGTAEIYRQLETIPGILESVVVGQEWQDDSRIVLFVKLAPDITLTPELQGHIKTTIRQATTARHVPAKIIAVADIPKTVSGKIVELAVSHVIHGRPVANINALANPDALKLFKNLPELKEI